jgi:organic hydroperoxide reductase OsmC/OhrA
MTIVEATFRTIPGTGAAEGRAGDHAVVVDLPAGVAGGAGAGMNGVQLLALAIGGCLCNDLRFVAAVRADTIDDVRVDVSLDIDDGIVTSADVVIGLAVPDGVNTTALINETVEISAVLAAVRNGFPITVS